MEKVILEMKREAMKKLEAMKKALREKNEKAELEAKKKN